MITLDLRTKVVVITGASSGIGRALAVAVAGRGAKLVLAARRQDRLEETIRAVEAARPGTEAMAVGTDVTEPAQVAEMVRRAVERYGHLDVLVNNAGVGHFGPIEEIQMDDLDRLLATNIRGLVTATKAALPYLRESRGMIVNISSGLSKRALPYLSAYAGTKSMVDAISDGLRLELKPYGIRVVTYGPPEVETEFHGKALGGRAGDLTATGGPPRKKARPETIAEEIARAIESEKREVTHSRFLQVMNVFAPGMLDRMFQGMVRARPGSGRDRD